jgi:hypothetical protein
MRRFNISTQRAWADAFIDRAARLVALGVARPQSGGPQSKL